jgi:predicted DNA-binding WGR domain protein
MPWYDRYKQEKIVVQQESGHNKFWAAHWDEATTTVHVRWGRLGTKGQTQEKKMGVHEASRFIETKYAEKRRKGYTEKYQGRAIDHVIFEKMATEAAIVGSSNKCHNMQWVEIVKNGVTALKPITDDRLSEPDCNPGLMVKLETKKQYSGSNKFDLLFTFDRAYLLVGGGIHEITKGHYLNELTSKVEEALGRSLTA